MSEQVSDKKNIIDDMKFLSLQWMADVVPFDFIIAIHSGISLR